MECAYFLDCVSVMKAGLTRTVHKVRHSRYRHNTIDLHGLENVRSSLALYLPPSSLLQLNI